VSTTSPEYKQLYENRQIGRWLDNNTFDSQVPLDEVVVRGNDERVLEGMRNTRQGFLEGVGTAMSFPQQEMVRMITGKKRKSPSEAWGFDTTNNSWYHPKSISNFAMDAVLDPMNLVGVGLVDDLSKGVLRLQQKLNPLAGVKFTPLKIDPFIRKNTDALINKIQDRLQLSAPTLRGYEDDQAIANISRNFSADNQLPPPPSMIYIPDSAPRQMTAAEKRQGVKDFLNYRDVDLSGVRNINDAEHNLTNWFATNRFKLGSNFDLNSRFSNIFNRYNIQPNTDIGDAARALPSDIKPQFLQDVVNAVPRKFTDDELMQMRIRWQDAQQSATTSSQPVIRNRSGLTKDEVIQRSKDKDKVSKMTEEEFQNTVLKPSGEIAEYVRGVDIDKLTYDPSSGRTILKDQRVMSEQEYADAFNQRIDLLNEIIADKNKSGVQYRVKELSPSGYLKFETPEQFIKDSNLTIFTTLNSL
jgi:hypothetical protein